MMYGIQSAWPPSTWLMADISPLDMGVRSKPLIGDSNSRSLNLFTFTLSSLRILFISLLIVT